MFIARSRTFWAGLVVVLLLLAGTVWILTDRPLYLVVLFDDVGSLKKEAPVLWKNFTIGMVTDIEPLVDDRIGVTVRIKSDYATKITRGSEFRLKPARLLGLLGESSIEVITPAVPGAAFVSGEKVQGTYERPASLAEEGRRWSSERWRDLKEQTARLIDELDKSPYRKDLEAALSEIRQLAEQAALQARDRLEEFSERHAEDLERIRLRLEKIRDAMKKQGDEEEARKVEKQLEKMKSP